LSAKARSLPAIPGPERRAAALLLATAGVARDLGVAPLARLVATGRVSAPPDAINVVPAQAAQAALAAADLRPGDIDLWEINEAFAAVTLTSIQSWASTPSA